jgi:hypothetical protein
MKFAAFPWRVRRDFCFGLFLHFPCRFASGLAVVVSAAFILSSSPFGSSRPFIGHMCHLCFLHGFPFSLWLILRK